MSIPNQNLIKCILLVQRNPQALIDYHTVLFPHPTSLIRQSMPERVDMIIIKVHRYDYYKSTKYYQLLFYERKKNISTLHKIICSLVSLSL